MQEQKPKGRNAIVWQGRLYDILQFATKMRSFPMELGNFGLKIEIFILN